MADAIANNSPSLGLGAGAILNVRHVLPTMSPVVCKGNNFVNVASVEQNSLRLSVPHKNYDIIITGTHKQAIAKPYIAQYVITKVPADDWKFIQEKYGQHPSFANKRIFAEKDEYQTELRAKGSEAQELSKMTGTAQLTEKSLNSSTLKPADEDSGGVTDVSVKKMS